MLTYEQASEIVLQEKRVLREEVLPVADLAGRVLSKPVHAPFDLPAFDNSAMDGYAVRTPVLGELKVLGEIAAGSAAHVPISAGEAARIFTGAPIPDGADAVVMQERTELVDGRLKVLAEVPTGDFIRRRGEEVERGEPLVEAGTFVGPAVLGCLAAAGVGDAAVWVRPRIAIVETGAELIDPGQETRPGGVFASNGLALAAACRAFGCEAKVSRCGDDEASLESTIRGALTDADVLITTGGVSVGDYDLVRPTLTRVGIEEKFWKAAIRPGRPIYFGTSVDGPVVFGLPGNPASALVTFYLFVVPFLEALQQVPARPWIDVSLGTDVDPSPAVTTFMRVRIEGRTAFPVNRQGSNMITSVMHADALLEVPAGSNRVPSSSQLRAMLLQWGWN